MATILDKPHEFDTFDDKYRKNKRAVERFLAFEIGVTTFHWDKTKHKYIAWPFNFVVYPRSTFTPYIHLFSVSIQIDFIIDAVWHYKVSSKLLIRLQ